MRNRVTRNRGSNAHRCVRAVWPWCVEPRARCTRPFRGATRPGRATWFMAPTSWFPRGRPPRDEERSVVRTKRGTGPTGVGRNIPAVGTVFGRSGVTWSTANYIEKDIPCCKVLRCESETFFFFKFSLGLKQPSSLGWKLCLRPTVPQPL